jgi:hypothetical protein
VRPEELPPTASAPGARLAVTALCALEGLVLLGFACLYGYEISIGESDSLARALMSMLLILVGGVALLLLARGWRTGGSWPRTPTIVWNALLLPVAWSLHQGGRTAIGAALAALAVASVVAAIAGAPADRRPAED